MLLVIDNYDSFTYNLVQYFGELHATMEIRRNDQITVEQALALHPEKIVISPGPGTPQESGISSQLIQKAGEKKIPVFGVCLGHQCIAEVYGGKVVRAGRLMHGKTSPILHKGNGLFKGLPNPFQATRYHSLLVQNDSVPECLEVTAWTQEGEIMGLSHKTLPIYGVQFHPESILTTEGKDILRNFLEM